MSPAGLAPHDPVRSPGAGPTRQAEGALPVPDPAVVAEPGPLLTTGHRADVFVLDDHTVLRRYRSGEDASAEVEVLRHVSGHGFPAPAVFAAQGPDLVMERLHGPTLLQALAAGEVSLPGGAAILLDLHERLHAVPAPGAAHAGDVVVHLDIHPGNVVLSESRGPSLVDWASARAGTAALDVAVTSLLLGEVAVDADGDYSKGARALLAAFATRSPVSPLDTLDEAVAARSACPSRLPEEIALIGQAAALVRELMRVSH